jgi:hypothetical protein
MDKSGTKLQGRAFIAFLNRLEAEIRPETCIYPDFNYWPVLRFAINYKRKMGRSFVARDLREIGQPLGALGRFLKAPGHHLRAVLGLGSSGGYPQGHFDALDPVDVLFVNRRTQYTRAWGGYVANPLTDGIRKLIGPVGPRCATYVDASPLEDGESYFVDTETLPEVLKTRPVRQIAPRDAREHRLRAQIIAKVSQVNALIAEEAPGLEINAFDVLQRIEVTSEYVDYWSHALDRLRPRVIFLSSFSGAHYICAAASKRGIPVVDVQHGGMNPYHPVAANWANVPDGGYELLPEIFWCWTERSASYIDFPGNTRHRAVVGGNPKAAVEGQYFDDPLPGRPRASGDGGKPRILVALQYGAEDLMMPHVKQVYMETRDDFDWRFRLHPMGWSRKDEAVSVLGIDPARLEADSLQPLHRQLPTMDLLLTNASTIVFEAMEYGVPPAICSDMGASLYDALIEAGEVASVQTEDAVRQVLDAAKQRTADQNRLRPDSDDISALHRRAVIGQFNDILKGAP